MFPRHSFYTIVIHRQKKKVKKCTNSPFAGLDESGVQCQSFSKVYEFLSKQNIPAGMKAPDRKAGPIYTNFKSCTLSGDVYHGKEKSGLGQSEL